MFQELNFQETSGERVFNEIPAKESKKRLPRIRYAKRAKNEPRDGFGIQGSGDAALLKLAAAL